MTRIFRKLDCIHNAQAHTHIFGVFVLALAFPLTVLITHFLSPYIFRIYLSMWFIHAFVTLFGFWVHTTQLCIPFCMYRENRNCKITSPTQQLAKRKCTAIGKLIDTLKYNSRNRKKNCTLALSKEKIKNL